MFWEIEFPLAISFGAVGGPSWNTTVNIGFSGFEQRNKNWQFPLCKYEVSITRALKAQQPGLSGQVLFDLLLEFWQNTGGQADPFRFLDFTDHHAVNVTLGLGDETTTDFQLIKAYTLGVGAQQRTMIRKITKPITSKVCDYQGNAYTDTVKVYVNGVLQTHHAGYSVDGTKDYSLDETTGIVKFVTAPRDATYNTAHSLNGGLADIVTAEFDFHVPVRFMTDDFKGQIEESDVAGDEPQVSWQAIQLMEVRL